MQADSDKFSFNSLNEMFKICIADHTGLNTSLFLMTRKAIVFFSKQVSKLFICFEFNVLYHLIYMYFFRQSYKFTYSLLIG